MSVHDLRIGHKVEAKDLMKLMLGDLHVEPDDPRLTIGSNWSVIVGEKAAQHSKPWEIRGDVLMVKADHPVWVQLLSMQQKSIVERVNTAYPGLNLKRLHVING